ncbi:MAG TPA: transposase [Armatimonadota bacterium]|nr:transposase [Armatimonadota bacterium]
MDKPLTQHERRRRKLPHWEEPGATYFVTVTLVRAAEVSLIRPDIAKLVVETLTFFDGQRYDLYDYTVMPDHIHAILKPTESAGHTERLHRIMHGIKGWLAHEINRVVGRSGQLWLHETYDRIIRDQREYEQTAEYILHNPRMAGLVDDPTTWPWWGRGSGQ